jgi:hypothetical protein
MCVATRVRGRRRPARRYRDPNRDSRILSFGLHLSQAAGKKGAGGVVGGKSQGSMVGFGCVLPAFETPEKVGTGGGQQVVVTELGLSFERVEQE